MCSYVMYITANANQFAVSSLPPALFSRMRRARTKKNYFLVDAIRFETSRVRKIRHHTIGQHRRTRLRFHFETPFPHTRTMFKRTAEVRPASTKTATTPCPRTYVCARLQSDPRESKRCFFEGHKYSKHAASGTIGARHTLTVFFARHFRISHPYLEAVVSCCTVGRLLWAFAVGYMVRLWAGQGCEGRGALSVSACFACGRTRREKIRMLTY